MHRGGIEQHSAHVRDKMQIERLHSVTVVEDGERMHDIRHSLCVAREVMPLRIRLDPGW